MSVIRRLARKSIFMTLAVIILLSSCGNSGVKTVKKQDKDTVKTRGYIYYRADAGKAVKELAAELKENRILNMEGIAVVEASKGQKYDWIFIDGKVMIIPTGGNDGVFEQALDFFGVDYDKYGLIR